jgi:recombination protein RecA
MGKLESFMAEVNKRFGENSAIMLDKENTTKVEVAPTGILSVDKAIGVGGFPLGRISEVFGAEGTGKTTLCLHAIAQAQKEGYNALFIDAEHAISEERMAALGVDKNRLVLSQPQSGEEALEIVEMAARDKHFRLVVVDSVAALIPKVEIEKEMGDSVMGVHARLMSQSMRKLTAPVARSKIALIFTNQVRAKIGTFFPTDETTGGRALKFYASLRIKTQFIGAIKEGKERVSGNYRITVVKNKLATPFKEVVLELNQYGFDEMGLLVEALVDAGVLTKSGTFYRHGEVVLGHGKAAVVQKLREDEELKKLLVEALHKARKVE